MEISKKDAMVALQTWMQRTMNIACTKPHMLYFLGLLETAVFTSELLQAKRYVNNYAVTLRVYFELKVPREDGRHEWSDPNPYADANLVLATEELFPWMRNSIAYVCHTQELDAYVKHLSKDGGLVGSIYITRLVGNFEVTMYLLAEPAWAE